MLYAKVRRQTGEVLKYRDRPADTEFATNKPEVWLPVRNGTTAETPTAGEEKMVRIVVVDLDGGEVVRQLTVVALTATEKDAWVRNTLDHSDKADMPRFAEELAMALIAKGGLALTDLSQAAQNTLATRKALRGKLR